MRRLAIAIGLLAAPTVARAGRTYYGWLYGTEVMPERGVELQSWIEERNIQFPTDHDRDTRWFVSVLVGITDQLELALPVEAEWYSDDQSAGSFVPRRYGAELRYRLVTQDPVHAPAFVPLVRVALDWDVAGAVHPEIDVVASYEHGRVHALADAGMFADFATRASFENYSNNTLPWTGNGDHHVVLHPGAGVSVRAVGDLRFGAEVYGELSLDGNENGNSWWVVGPDMAWTQGRFWLSATFGIGVWHIHSAPRIIWGIAF